MVALLSPVQFVARIRAIGDLWLRRRVLRQSRQSCLAQLAYLDHRRLLWVEQGRQDEWHLCHTELREILAETEQALATC